MDCERVRLVNEDVMNRSCSKCGGCAPAPLSFHWTLKLILEIVKGASYTYLNKKSNNFIESNCKSNANMK